MAAAVFGMFALASPALAAPGPAACDGLKAFALPAVTISSATTEAAGPFAGAGGVVLPAHCKVTGVIDARKGFGGKPYAINFEMRLPQDWNGRFLFQGGGGLNGVVKPAIGQVKGPPALIAGFAVVTEDAGHQVKDASFGEDQQARLDNAYRSYERVTLVAKQLIGAYYGKAPDHSYFMGCSEGGRQALLMSQRMPSEYDGVVAGDPGFKLGVSIQGMSDKAQVATITPRRADGRLDWGKAFTAADLKLAQTQIVNQCDAKDGLKDGLIDNWPACRPDFSKVTCQGGKTAQCLSKGQVAVIRAVFDGANIPGVGISGPGYPYDTGLADPSWLRKLSGGGRENDAGGVTIEQGLFLTPYDTSFQVDTMDFAKDPQRMAEFGGINRADGVMYSTFRQRGGKILIYTGVSDPAFSPKDLIAYYARLAAANGGVAETNGFARIFLSPGMTHCRGGQSLDDFAPLSALVDWVEKGQAPEKLIATGKAFPGRSRPLCPYPQQSRYKGTGSIEDAANFACRAP